MKQLTRVGGVLAAAVMTAGVAMMAPATALAAENTQQAAVQLEDALRALPLNHVDFLYAYLQSVQFTQNEITQIDSNAKQIQQLFHGDTTAYQLTRTQKVEAVRLFLQSAQLAHLKTSFVDQNGQPINIIDYKFNGHVYVQLKDEKGNLLATLDPKVSDVAPSVMAHYVHDVAVAVNAAEILGNSGKFVPMPHGKLPVTANNDPAGILVGSLLILLGGLSIIPIVMVARRQNRSTAKA